MLPFDPDEFAETTNTLQVGMVRRRKDNVLIEVKEWLPTQTVGEIHALRPQLRKSNDESIFDCFGCGFPVILKKHPNGGHYFSHKHKSDADKAKCPYQESRGISQAELDRIRYHGQREGKRHERTKEFVRRILAADTNFSDIKVEEVWKSFIEGWRKPDVSAKWKNQPVVFEAQVSNTYPQVVAERTEFYTAEKALLIWIFDQLPDDQWRTLHADTFCSNHQHLYLVDEQCTEASERDNQAYLRLYCLRPDVETFKDSQDDRIRLKASCQEWFGLVPFSALHIDIERQTSIFFDVEEDRRRMEHKILCAQAQAGCSFGDLEASIRSQISRQKPISDKSISGWAALICAIEAVRIGEAVGTRLANVAGVLNNLYDHYPQFFPHLVDTLRRLGIESKAPQAGAWRTHVDDYDRGQYRGEPFPSPHQGSDSLLKWLYPDEAIS